MIPGASSKNPIGRSEAASRGEMEAQFSQLGACDEGGGAYVRNQVGCARYITGEGLRGELAQCTSFAVEHS